MLAWGAVALLALAGLGLDALWHWAAANLKMRWMNLSAAVRWAVAWLGLIALAGVAGASVIDLYLKYRPITRGSYTTVALQTEWLLRRRQVPDGRQSDVSGYAYARWRFARRWDTAVRYEAGTAARDGDGEVGDDLDPEWVRARHRAAINLTFWPSEFSRLRAQGQVDLPRWRDDPIWSYRGSHRSGCPVG